MISLIPMWVKALIFAAICAALFGLVKIHDHKVFKAGQADVQAKWDAAEARRVVATDKAILDRIAKNALDAAEQAKTNQSIKKAHDDEIAKINSDYDRARAAGLRISANICNSAARPAETTGTGKLDGAAAIELPAETQRRLFDLAEDADRVSDQLKKLQEWAVESGF